MSQITKYEEVLTKTRLVRCMSAINDGAWQFGGGSTPESKSKFWYMNLMHEPLFSKIIFEDIKKMLCCDFILDQCYANGQTYGQDGSFHYDGTSQVFKDEWTFLLYLTNVGGNTEILIDNEKETIMSIEPRINTAVLFPQNLMHRGLAPTRNCYDLRVTVAFKMTEQVSLPF